MNRDSSTPLRCAQNDKIDLVERASAAISVISEIAD